MQLPESILIKKQTKVYGPKIYTEHGCTYKLTVTVRYDDSCGNGHNTFSITAMQYRKSHNGAWVEDSCGCMYETIAARFPELAQYIKWHLTSSDGPLHYITNTVYLVGDRDCWGLRKDELRQIINGKTKKPSWELVARHKVTHEVIPSYKLQKYTDADTAPECEYELIWQSWDKVGEGKVRELDKARRVAIWPDATDEELIAPGLKERLEARLPGLMQEFKATVEGLGFIY